MAKDIYHNLVKQALENDGWTITHDPFYLSVGIGRRKVATDLGQKNSSLRKKGLYEYWSKSRVLLHLLISMNCIIPSGNTISILFCLKPKTRIGFHI